MQSEDFGLEAVMHDVVEAAIPNHDGVPKPHPLLACLEASPGPVSSGF